MVYRFSAIALLLSCLSTARAETVQLRDKASVTGKILAQKRDQVVIDLGFTVLTIPRNAIQRITEEEVVAAKGKARRSSETAAAAPLGSSSELFSTAGVD